MALGGLQSSLLGALGRSWGAPGGHFGLPGVAFWSFVGLFLKPPWKLAKTFKNIVFSMVFDGFWPPRGGPKSTPDGSQIAFGRVWAPRGALLAPLGAVLASLGGILALLGASWAPLGPLLGRFVAPR